MTNVAACKYLDSMDEGAKVRARATLDVMTTICTGKMQSYIKRSIIMEHCPAIENSRSEQKNISLLRLLVLIATVAKRFVRTRWLPQPLFTFLSLQANHRHAFFPGVRLSLSHSANSPIDLAKPNAYNMTSDALMNTSSC